MTKKDRSKTFDIFNALGDNPTYDELLKNFGKTMVTQWLVRSYRKYRDGFIKRNSTHHPPTTERKLNEKIKNMTEKEYTQVYDALVKKLTK